MSPKKIGAVSFTDVNGAEIIVPAEMIALYSTIKSDQLTVLSRIIADHAAGFKVSFDENAIASLAGLAGELAHACNEFMCSLSNAVFEMPKDSEKKGGA